MPRLGAKADTDKGIELPASELYRPEGGMIRLIYSLMPKNDTLRAA